MAALFYKIPQLLIFLACYDSQSVYAKSMKNECPLDCVCYHEYLSNLASWKWIEKDINVQKDDPMHDDFNPYVEHNEVYDNPLAVKNRQKEGLLNMVTCILRSNTSESLISTLSGLNSDVQVLSLMKAPGSGSLTLKKIHMEKLYSLIGLEVQGYSSHENKDTLLIEADAFLPLKKLTYLSMDAVVLLQRSVENDVEEGFGRTIIQYNYTSDSNNEINPPSVIILQPLKAREGNEIVPYSVYKSESKSAPYPILPKIAVAFTNLPNLQHLKISGCKLQDISWDMFNKLDNLKYLLLENNDLLFLPDFVFYSTSNLTALSLSRNRILNLQTVGLVGLLYLQKLDVSYNNITHLSELSLPPFPHLEKADFRFNPIESIFPNTFEIMNSTKTLLIGSPTTPIEFSPNSFYGLISLNRLDVINVKIGFLERPMFKGMPELKSLTLTGTITRISYDAFSEVPKLEKLVLKECFIQKISMDALFGLSSLIELDISHNSLTFLPPGLFDQQVSLREVFLQHNKLKTLPPSMFSKIPAKLIRLEGNPWVCSCDMKYWDSKIINQVKQYHVPQPNITFCNKQYDKGFMCYQDFEPSFEVKYAYEKRVSPVCKAPSKYAERSVFEVLRKDLNYCANSLQKNISIILKASNPTETIEKMGLYKDPNKEMEKQILFPPKIKKPWKTVYISTTTPPKYTSSVSSVSMNQDEMDNNIINRIPEMMTSSNSEKKEIKSGVLNPIMAENVSKIVLTAIIKPMNSTIKVSKESQASVIDSVEKLFETDPGSKPLKSKSTKARNNKRKNNQDEEIINTNINLIESNYGQTVPHKNINNSLPPLSKKALKLRRQHKKLLRTQQQEG